MPIRPENRDRYPSNWKEIRARILERAGHRCERCDKPNGEVVSVLPGGFWWDWDMMAWRDRNSIAVGSGYSGPHAERQTRVVLTIAHWPDPAPENCADDNLWALCQACHLRIDMDTHVANARETRRRKKSSKQGNFCFQDGLTGAD